MVNGEQADMSVTRETQPPRISPTMVLDFFDFRVMPMQGVGVTLMFDSFFVPKMQPGVEIKDEDKIYTGRVQIVIETEKAAQIGKILTQVASPIVTAGALPPEPSIFNREMRRKMNK